GIWLDQTIDHAQERCLARARGANHSSNRAWWHGEAVTVNDRAAAIGLGQRVEFDHPAGLRAPEPWQRAISASISTAAANARLMVGTVPSRTMSMAIWLMPWTRTPPKPRAPFRVAMDVRPMSFTSAVRFPARIAGTAKGSSTCHRRCAAVMPRPRDASRAFAGPLPGPATGFATTGS